MDIQPDTTKPMSDDQELAKVLAGVSQQIDDKPLDFEETPLLAPPVAVEPSVVADTTPIQAPLVEPEVSAPAPSGDLDSIKSQALTQLRPLVDKLELAPEEKFDTYLLLLRSTDDTALIAPAYTAAQAIIDESRKAQALLDVIKEIDYLSAPKA
jgi:hypothetical protein